MAALAGLGGVSPAWGFGFQFEAEFGTGVAQGLKVAHLGLDGREVTHGWLWFLVLG